MKISPNRTYFARNLLLALCFVSSSALFSQGKIAKVAYLSSATGVLENFNDNVLTNWSAGSYGLTETGGVLKVIPQKNGVWDGFDYKFSTTAIDLTSNPYVILKIKSNFDFNISLAVGNANGKIDNYPLKFSNTLLAGAQEIVASDIFQEYSFDFTGIPASALQTANNLHFVLNPLTRLFGDAPNKEIYFDDLKVGDVAVRTPAISTIQEQLFTVQPSGNSSRTVSFRNVTDGSTGSNAITITATSSNTAVIPNPTVVYSSPDVRGSLVLNPNVLATGESTISVTVSAPNTTPKIMTFKVKVLANAAPTMNIIPSTLAIKGQLTKVLLKNIYDGNVESDQNVTITAVSSNTAVIPSVSILHNPKDFVGILSFTPSATAANGSTSTITVTLKDNGGTTSGGTDTKTYTFIVSVYNEVNNAPSFDVIPTKTIKANAGTDQMQITGITDGDNNAQGLTFVASASNTTIVNNLVVSPVVDGVATLSFNRTGAQGTATITITATDNGVTAANNGNQSFTQTFVMNAINAPVTGLATNYVPFVPNLSGSGVTTGLSGGVITFASDNSVRIKGTVPRQQFPSSYFDIKALTGGKELDISAAKRVSFKVKSAYNTTSNGGRINESKLTFRLIDNITPSADPASSSGYAVSAIENIVPNDDKWHDIYLDFTGKFSKVVGGFTKSTDSTRISRLMLDINLTYFNELTVDFFFKDIKLGDMADLPVPSPKTTITKLPAQTYFKGDIAKPIILSGISDGQGNKTAQVTVTTNKPSLVTNLSVGSVVNGTATLSYTLAPGVADSATVKVLVKNASVATAKADSTVFKVYVVDQTLVTTGIVTINAATTYQTIAGIGGFLDNGKDNMQVQYIKDLNITALRLTSDGDFEPVNDNTDSNITNYANFNKSSLPVDIIRNVNENTKCHIFNYSLWTAPNWMKQNKANYPDPDAQWAANNRLKPEMYEEFAEHIVAICKTIKLEAGVELYSISLQNEPTFNEPYSSTQYNGNEFRELMKIVGPRMQAEGLSTIIMLSEDVNANNWVQSNVIPTNEDPIARKYLGIVACHLYDPDGIKVGGSGATGWTNLNNFFKTTLAKGLWMTETSGYSNVWEGEWIPNYLNTKEMIYSPGPLDFAGAMYTSFKHGQISGWTDFDSPAKRVREDLIGGVFKNYSKFINPGSVMVNATSSNANVLSLAFKNADNSSTVVLLNNSSKPIKVTLAGSNVSQVYEIYSTQNFSPFAKGTNVTNGTVLLPARSIVTLYHANSNAAPSVDQLANQNLMLSEGTKTIPVVGINYGADAVAQDVTSVTAASSNVNIATVSVNYTNNAPSANLIVTPVSLGTTTITVKVKDNGGIAGGGIDEKSMSFTVTVKQLTVINDLKKAVLSVYPNPANDFIVVSLDNEIAERITITDLSGRIVQQQNVNNKNDNFRLSVSNLSKGIYFVTVKMKEQSQTIRLIRQ